jgi:hypothetical protein
MFHVLVSMPTAEGAPRGFMHVGQCNTPASVYVFRPVQCLYFDPVCVSRQAVTRRHA